MSRAIIATVY